jgi:uncharacterized protein
MISLSMRGSSRYFSRSLSHPAAESNDLKGGTYFARLVLSAESELQQKKIIEIDARPSDCIAMATQQPAPIYVSLDVWDELEDMTEALRKMQQEGSHTEESDEEEES